MAKQVKKSETVFKPEGEVKEFKGHDAIRTDKLDWFECRKGLFVGTITKEFQSVCPGSGQPDQATLQIKYFADGGRAVEMKSLKYYMGSFRNVGIFQEHVTFRIYDDLCKLLQTKRLEVFTEYLPRGGFTTSCGIGSLGQTLADLKDWIHSRPE
jgi:7-cyano-7-deazaguanine reductase